MNIVPIGDHALSVQFENVISPSVNQKVHRLHEALKKEQPAGMSECVPGYRALTVYYDPLQIQCEHLYELISNVFGRMDEASEGTMKTYYLPVCYDISFGQDIERLAVENELSVDEVVALHSGSSYFIYMLGFTPGFPYLGGLEERLRTPRLETPRGKVEAGSVGIADAQTGVYSIDSPGGWNIIGKTPVPLFNAAYDEPALLTPGHLLRFEPIAYKEYVEIEKSVGRGEYSIRIEEEGEA
ncbi:sensor histidine kinase inhibitor, KipI family [Marinococcus luteus]|uniref:Sensor histidine kinase inhibitor, KipI family n=1 Tax=Marinococcus luteus TaxID=1122204 RepID=A0A1H2Y8J6_9BACI|nr:5-oxoprolinase subunit PxpB [Marinococcus luteus]SDX00994.1 sensor histidine kinase inhibitor, KipI family [Marinococcus luteus]